MQKAGLVVVAVVMVAVDTNKKVKCRRWVAMIGTQHRDY